jgi:hypothetical protein
MPDLFRQGSFSQTRPFPTDAPMPEQVPTVDPRLSSADPVVAMAPLNGMLYMVTNGGAIWRMTANPLTLTQLVFP